MKSRLVAALAAFGLFSPEWAGLRSEQRSKTRVSRATLIARATDSLSRVADRYRAILLKRGCNMYSYPDGRIFVARNRKNADRKLRNYERLSLLGTN